MTDHKLRCNSLKCRKELSGRALVTTCSHIFCTDCAAHSGLAGPGSGSRHSQEHVCPACHMSLQNPDDAVIANLNPSEDYKTSVLSGLSPTVIMECASRALGFWAYQTTQEVSYQAFLGKALADKYSHLTVHLDKVINDANAQITSLHTSLKSSTDEQKALHEKNAELAQAYKDKNRKLLQVQELYDKLKRKAMLGQIQDAAEDAVDSGFRPDGAIDGGVPPYGDDDTNAPPFYQDQSVPYGRPGRQLSDTTNRMGGIYSSQEGMIRHGPSFPRTIGAQADIPITPSTHRQRLGEQPGIGLSAVPGFVSGSVRSPRPAANARAPLSELHGNFRHNGRLATGGLSSGMKVGLGSGSLPEYNAASRPQAIQRPAPPLSGIGRRDLAHGPGSIVSSSHSASISGNMKRGYAPR
ncbi:cyclin [Apiospora rasikravindrae]|uniref:Cyclin n=1 Tax=Apiospora rasikravindrae TaxID=990691 RepID=A0ABR1TZU8_9PEZI